MSTKDKHYKRTPAAELPLDYLEEVTGVKITDYAAPGVEREAIPERERGEVKRETIKLDDALVIVGHGTERSMSVTLHTVTREWWSWVRERWVGTRAVSVLDVIEGGRSSGEGRAEQSRFFFERAITAEQARSFVELAAADALPKYSSWSEL